MGNDYHANLTGSDLHIVKVHAINSTAAHTGTPAAVTGDLIVFDANGLPADSGNVLPNGTTATTQSAGDNSTKVATTAYVDRGPSSAYVLPNGTTATTQSAGDNSTNVATTAFVTAAAHFGSWTFNGFTAGTSYHATTDGFVVAFATNSGGANAVLTGITDSSATPTTVLIVSSAFYEGGQNASITMPVRKGDYWKVTQTNANAPTISWLPLGN